MICADETVMSKISRWKTQPGRNSALFSAIWQTEMFQLFLFIQPWGCSVSKAADVYAGDSKTALNATESVLHVSKAQQDSAVNSFSALLMQIMPFSVCVYVCMRVRACAPSVGSG